MFGIDVTPYDKKLCFLHLQDVKNQKKMPVMWRLPVGQQELHKWQELMT